jgi:hypothetical protein
MDGVAHTYQVERQVAQMRLSLLRIDSFRRKKEAERNADDRKPIACGWTARSTILAN